MRSQAGISTSETILLMPLFLLLTFGVLQMAQLATALIIANYAASSIAREAVKDDNASSGDQYRPKMDKLMSVGMKNPHIVFTPVGTLMPTLEVDTCAEVTAFPFIGQLLGPGLAKGFGANASSANCKNVGNPFGFRRSQPAVFVVHGKAKARMNYKPG